MSEGIIVSLITSASTIIVGIMTAFVTIYLTEQRNGERLGCGLLGLATSIEAFWG